MQNRKEEIAEPQEQDGVSRSIRCQVCGSEVDADGCLWQEDDDGVICCRECRAERESCGCSDQ